MLTAIGAYQLRGGAAGLAPPGRERDVPHSVVYMLEPGRFRAPRSEGERAHAAPAALRASSTRTLCRRACS